MNVTCLKWVEESFNIFFIQILFMTEEVLNIFDNEGTSNEQNLFSQILMLYYILFYQYTYFRNLKQLHVMCMYGSMDDGHIDG